MTDGGLQVVDSRFQLWHLLRLDLQVVDIPQARHQHLLGGFQLLQQAIPDIFNEITAQVCFRLSVKPVFLQVTDVLLGLIESAGGVTEAESRLLQLHVLLLQRALCCNKSCLG